MKKILVCVGTRPNFIKVTQFKKLSAHYGVEVKILHTGQHYDHTMSKVFFDELQLDEPDIYLDAKGHTQIDMLADIMVKFEKELLIYDPDVVLVPGDVNSSVACALAASRNGYKVGHIESGLRSFDRTMPEEINRILIDDLSDIFFVTEQSGLDHLHHEGKDKEKIHFVGNTMMDSLVAFNDVIDSQSILEDLSISDDYCLMTFHRPSNVDFEGSLNELVDVINKCSTLLKVVFPVHPRTKKSLHKFGLWDQLDNNHNVKLVDSLGYLDFMKLVKNAKVVVTDSGGVQEETTFLQVPCLTVRENTERPITIAVGTNELVKLEASLIFAKVGQLLMNPMRSSIPPLWDGHSTERILEILAR